jgi:predicted metal-dependent hydrolase
MNRVKAKGIDYQIVRSARATADIVVERDGRIIVRAPTHLPDERVEDIVEAKRYWIYKTLAEWRDLNATRVPREYRNGEGFLYLGRSYRLLLVAQQDEPLLLKNGRFCLRRDIVERTDTHAAQSVFRDYFTGRGMEHIHERVRYYAPKVGVAPTGLDVRELGYRWALCSASGGLAFHWKCMMAPQTIIDYIVVHELCHLHFRDHTEAFWNEVDKVIPAYRERKAWLRMSGAGLDV